MPSSIAVQSSLPSSHAARRALRGLENTTPSLFSTSSAVVVCPKVNDLALVASLPHVQQAQRGRRKRHAKLKKERSTIRHKLRSSNGRHPSSKFATSARSLWKRSPR